MADNKSPWGGGGAGGDAGKGDDAGSGSGNGAGGGGPRNPWAQPPGGRPRGTPGPSALDEFLKRARGGGGGPIGGGRSPIPGAPSPASLWAIGAGILVLLWLVFTSVHSIGPQQRGLVTFLGRYARTLGPGINLTLPAPLTAVQKIDVSAISTDTFPEGGNGENLMLTSDQNIVDFDYLVQWDIRNPQDYAFQIKDPKSTLRASAESAMRAIVATSTLEQAIGNGRGAMEARALQLMQQILDSYNSGIRIRNVSIKGASAPSGAIEDFKAVSAAQQEAQTNIYGARAYAQQVLARAQGDAAAFNVLYTQYKLAPEVTRRRMYYEAMEDVLRRSDKTIVEAPGVQPYLSLSGGARKVPDAPAPQLQGAGQ